jgi:bloom syndrome protein
MVSSPASHQRKPTHRFGHRNDEDDYAHDDFVASDDEDDAFEPMSNRRHRREDTPGDDLGPPITIDQRMANLPDIHRDVISDFVEKAKELEENLRNRTGVRKPFFTEANFREMAIKWTVTPTEMMQIPDINVERVKTYGSHFVKLVTQCYTSYDQMMAKQEDGQRDVDTNHQNVIDLISDDEDYGSDNGDEEAILEAEQEGSKYFGKPTYGSISKSGDASSRKLPWPEVSDAKASSSRGGASSYRGKGRGTKRTFSRKSNGSASSSSGVSKRKFSGGAKKPRANKASGSNTSKGSSLMREFGNHRGGGMGDGGIGMMPT